jgi:hypothetical protein
VRLTCLTDAVDSLPIARFFITTPGAFMSGRFYSNPHICDSSIYFPPSLIPLSFTLFNTHCFQGTMHVTPVMILCCYKYASMWHRMTRLKDLSPWVYLHVTTVHTRRQAYAVCHTYEHYRYCWTPVRPTSAHGF